MTNWEKLIGKQLGSLSSLTIGRQPAGSLRHRPDAVEGGSSQKITLLLHSISIF